MITSSKKKEIIINIHILSGNLKVSVYDFFKVSITRDNPKGNNNIHIVVPSEELSSTEKK